MQGRDGVGEAGEEVDGGGVVWGGMGRAYLEVLLETSDSGRWILVVDFSSCCKKEGEGEEGEQKWGE